VKCKSNSPTQLVIGPGRIGKKLPIMPNAINKAAIKSKRISINVFLFDA
jgi:hypothetical protein